MRKHIEELAEKSREESFYNSFNQEEQPRFSQFTDQAPERNTLNEDMQVHKQTWNGSFRKIDGLGEIAQSFASSPMLEIPSPKIESTVVQEKQEPKETIPSKSISKFKALKFNEQVLQLIKENDVKGLKEILLEKGIKNLN